MDLAKTTMVLSKMRKLREGKTVIKKNQATLFIFKLHAVLHVRPVYFLGESLIINIPSLCIFKLIAKNKEYRY